MFCRSISPNEATSCILVQQKNFLNHRVFSFSDTGPHHKIGSCQNSLQTPKATACFYLLGSHLLSLILCFEKEAGDGHEVTGETIPEEKSLLEVRFKNQNAADGQFVPCWSEMILGNGPCKSRSYRKQSHFNKQVLSLLNQE